jgi:hypothetical protein
LEEEPGVTLLDVVRVMWWDGTQLLPIPTLKWWTSATTADTVVRSQWYIDDTPKPQLQATLVGVPTNPVIDGTVVTLTAGAVGGVAPYAYTITASAGAPTPVLIGVGRWTITVPSTAAAGDTYGYSVTATDSSTPKLSAAASYTVGVGVTPPPSPTLTTALQQKPGNPVARGTVVTLTAQPAGGVPPYTYVFPAPAGAPPLSGTGATRTLTVPSTALDGTSWPYSVTVSDSSNPPQSASAPHSVKVSAPVVIRQFVGKKSQVRMGMRSSVGTWDARWADVQGAVTVGGVSKNRVTGKRVYAFTDNTTSYGVQSADKTEIENAIAQGLMPVISVKDQSVANAATSAELSAMTKFGNYLRGLGVDIGVSYWHEPHNNFTGTAGSAMYVQKQKQYMPLLQGSNVSRGPILDGWLLQGQQARFQQFCPDELFDPAYWEWFGWDCYGSGSTLGDDSRPWASDHVVQARDYLKTRGFGDWNGFIGEWNGWTGAQINEFCETVLSLTNSNNEPFMWMACLWDQDGGKGAVLETSTTYGTRLQDYKAYLDDPRVWSPAQGDS